MCFCVSCGRCAQVGPVQREYTLWITTARVRRLPTEPAKELEQTVFLRTRSERSFVLQGHKITEMSRWSWSVPFVQPQWLGYDESRVTSGACSACRMCKGYKKDTGNAIGECSGMVERVKSGDSTVLRLEGMWIRGDMLIRGSSDISAASWMVSQGVGRKNSEKSGYRL